MGYFKMWISGNENVVKKSHLNLVV